MKKKKSNFFGMVCSAIALILGIYNKVLTRNDPSASGTATIILVAVILLFAFNLMVWLRNNRRA